MSDGVSRRDVINRIDDWIKRLNKLYREILSWSKQLGIKCEISEMLQINEELMKKYKVSPRNIPFLILKRDGKRIVFIPNALWIIGADGRVNIITDKEQHTLVDLRENKGCPSEWNMVVGNIKKSTQPFTRTVFLELWGKDGRNAVSL